MQSQTFLSEFSAKVLGSLTLPDYAAGLFFALIGALISLRLYAKTRNKHSEKTPVAFSWKFLIQDNVQRLFNGFLVTFILFRFAPEILEKEFSMFYALGIGLCFDQVIGLLGKLQKAARK